MKTIGIGLLLLTLLTSASYAHDSEQGWGLFFKKDTFDGTVFPIAMMTEAGDSFDKASVGVVCGKNGDLVPFYTGGLPSLHFGTPPPITIQFKDGDETRSFKFQAQKIPYVGNEFALSGDGAAAFIRIFSDASGPVAFRSKSGQGKFSTIAAKQVFAMVKESCPTPEKKSAGN